MTLFSAAHAGPSRISALPSATLSGTRMHAIGQQGCVQLVLDELDAGRGGWIMTVNLNHLRLSVLHPDYAATIRRATLVVPDGMPLLWASRLQGTPLPERVPGCELIWSLSEGSARRGRSVFLLGGNPGTAEGTATILQATYPGLQVAGALCPERGFEQDEHRMAQIRQALIDARPDVVFVALGTPKEEYWINAIRETLPAAWWIGVGGGFSFACGEVPRAPLWMQRAGLEWLHRLTLEPRRLGRRYLLEGVPFAMTLFGEALRRRLSPEMRDTPPATEE
jgi:N-acetylglucosaminyldiphosphoundecaprenol N-acetyl-beta-D-mannosaminyltransferase